MLSVTLQVISCAVCSWFRNKHAGYEIARTNCLFVKLLQAAAVMSTDCIKPEFYIKVAFAHGSGKSFFFFFLTLSAGAIKGGEVSVCLRENHWTKGSILFPLVTAKLSQKTRRVEKSMIEDKNVFTNKTPNIENKAEHVYILWY